MTLRPVFHSGELAVQEKLGIAEKMDRLGRRVIRDYMPAQHREFYQQIPMAFLGHTDVNGRPWASVLSGQAGFIQSPDEHKLSFNIQPFQGDPLATALETANREKPVQVGMLGIELPTRRRNRLTGEISNVGDGGFDLRVHTTFGNCPQYIQTREPSFIDDNVAGDIVEFSQFNQQTQSFIQNADTFFVASSNQSTSSSADNPDIDGADVSHRGGKSGFVRVDNTTTLTIPDYLGNFHFNTLGNFLVNPKAGLLFIDFDTGDVYTVTGRAEIVWESDEIEHFTGAERLWRFHLEQGYLLERALPLRWQFNEYSPNSLLAGNWQEAQAKADAEALSNAWRDYQIFNIQDEGEAIRSFYMRPIEGSIPAFKPGQFATIQCRINDSPVIRTYTASSAPNDDFLRISVKREMAREPDAPDGLMSNHLHQKIKVDDVVQLKAPTGQFYLDTSEKRPAVLLAGGVGITPMISIARQVLSEGTRTRHSRTLYVFTSFRTKAQQAFENELRQISEASNGNIQAFHAISCPEEHLKPGEDYQAKGQIDKALLQSVLPLDRYDFYLCGPGPFMQAMYDTLRSMAVPDCAIFAESFGPASLTRDKSVEASEPDKPQPPVAESAVVEFADAKVEQAWTPEQGTLLEFAESHGFTPPYGCRTGQCGSCKVKLLQGQVSYNQEVDAQVADDEVLLCCAMPAASDEDDVAQLTIGL